MRIFCALLSLCFLAMTYAPVSRADGYSKGYSQETLDEAAARRALAEIPGFKMDDVWFATGLEDYYKSPSCITERNIYAFTKPVAAAPGLYRGKKTYLNLSNGPGESHVCNALKATDYGFKSQTASFIDPDDIHPDEAFDGLEPGLFQVDEGITDKELLALLPVIQQIAGCLKESNSCPFKVEIDPRVTKTYAVVPALKAKNLIQLNLRHDAATEKDYYELFFNEEQPNFGAVAVDIYYRNEKPTKVSLSDEVLE